MSANLEQIIEQVLQLPPEDLRRLRARLDEELARGEPQMTEDEFEQMLHAKGIITPAKDRTAVGELRAIPVRGKPVSETVIEDRD